jgi:hypothetical protein
MYGGGGEWPQVGIGIGLLVVRERRQEKGERRKERGERRKEKPIALTPD